MAAARDKKKLAMVSIKWRGTPEERKGLDEWSKKIADKVEGCEYKGLYSSWQSEYNWAYLYEVEDMGKLQKAMSSLDYDRDWSKLPAIVTEFWSGPM